MQLLGRHGEKVLALENLLLTDESSENKFASMLRETKTKRKVRFKGIGAFAKQQGRTRVHCYLVLMGKRSSRAISQAWKKYAA